MKCDFKATKDVKMSPAEMERRRKAVRSAMKEKGLDILLVRVPGNVQWLTNMTPAGHMPPTLIFPWEGDMQLVTDGGRKTPVPAPPRPGMCLSSTWTGWMGELSRRCTRLWRKSTPGNSGPISRGRCIGTTTSLSPKTEKAT